MRDRGVTPVIATVLLLMMTVAAAGAAYFWMTGLQTRLQSEIGETASTVTSNVELQFDIRYKKCNATETGGVYGNHSEIEMVLENTGTSAIPKGGVGLTLRDEDGNDLEFISSTCTQMITDLAVSTFLDMKCNVSTDLVSGEDYILRVALPSGAVNTARCTAQS